METGRVGLCVLGEGGVLSVPPTWGRKEDPRISSSLVVWNRGRKAVRSVERRSSSTLR